MSDEYNPDLISLTDEEGKEYRFEVLDAIETDEARYVALLPIFDTPEEKVADSGELIILREAETTDSETYFEEIENDEEYDTIADAFVGRLQDFFEIAENEE